MRFLWATAFIKLVLSIENFVIPGWDLQSVSTIGDEPIALSTESYDSSSWYHVGSRRTVFAGLLEAGVYDIEQIFHSENLQNTVDYLPFYSPWLYRSSFALSSTKGNHVFLQTNGITSKADIYLNGHEVANKLTQAGAYGGQIYDITAIVRTSNALVIKVYPTDYNKDFAIGFVDWNPYPPDNGTGVWRDVSIKQTGAVFLGPLRILNDFVPGAGSVQVTMKADVTNLETSSVTVVVQGLMSEVQNAKVRGVPPVQQLTHTLKLGPLQTKTVSLTATLEDPKIWWPKRWGEQPLYNAELVASVNGTLSDQTGEHRFGIRHVTSELNKHSDVIFFVNGHAFQVLGAGYAPDMFLRWSEDRFEAQAQYVLDMGLNTIRLEGKEEHPELYAIADRIGLMVIPGWECCDKWEAWIYNNEVTATLWDANDFETANVSMRHEAAMLQTHPSMLAFLVGSDYWPGPRAAAIYVEALADADWPNPIITSAAKRGYAKILGPGGMKMNGPYDWVPPNYWYGDQVGAAFGFGSELGAGVGTPEIGSLKRFLSEGDLTDLWTKPWKGLYHMSTNVSSFYDRHIYDFAMNHRYGAPTSLDDYLLKAQMMDYEATRAEFEGYSAMWNAERPATGLIYWMLNNAWPSLHWNLFDYYLHPAGSYFGTKVASRMEHVAYNYGEGTVYLINHSLNCTGQRVVAIELIDLAGKLLAKKTITAQTAPNTSKRLTNVLGLGKVDDVAFLRLILSDSQASVLSRNVYWLSRSHDRLIWDRSTWFYTPVSHYANFTALNSLATVSVTVSVARTSATSAIVKLENQDTVPAFFIRLNLVDAEGADVVPVHWSDNYVTLWPHETLDLQLTYPANAGKGVSVDISGSNIDEKSTVKVA